MTKIKEEIDLSTFVSRCESQVVAAQLLGCTQGNISQALKDIQAGIKTVRVRLYANGTAEADIVKPFGTRKAKQAA